MTGIQDWSETAGGNTSVGSINWNEGQAPSTVNNSAREVMAQLAAHHKGTEASTTEPGSEWVNDGKTKVYVSATQFKITGQDVRTAYHVGRRVRASGTATGIIRGTITASAFSTDTTITVEWAAGASGLENEALTIWYMILSANNAAPTLRIKTGSYTGNGTSQSITGFGFRPKWIWIVDRETSDGVGVNIRWTTDTIVDDNASGMSISGGGNSSVGRIASLDADGFSVASNGTPNTNGLDYNYVAVG